MGKIQNFLESPLGLVVMTIIFLAITLTMVLIVVKSVEGIELAATGSSVRSVCEQKGGVLYSHPFSATKCYVDEEVYEIYHDGERYRLAGPLNK